MSLKYELREYDPVTEQGEKDRKFWLDAWLKSYRQSDWAGVCPNHLYYDLHRMILDGLLERGAKIHMICVPERPDSFMGFICTEGNTVHYVYVKEPWRRNNLAAQVLVDKVGKKFSYSFRTKYSGYFSRKNGWMPTFAPEAVRKKDAK